MEQGRCTVCGEVFREKEIVIRLREWNADAEPADNEWVHFDCALYLSKSEKNRDHPPE
jgi:hypothetical protein